MVFRTLKSPTKKSLVKVRLLRKPIKHKKKSRESAQEKLLDTLSHL